MGPHPIEYAEYFVCIIARSFFLLCQKQQVMILLNQAVMFLFLRLFFKIVISTTIYLTPIILSLSSRPLWTETGWLLLLAAAAGRRARVAAALVSARRRVGSRGGLSQGVGAQVRAHWVRR